MEGRCAGHPAGSMVAGYYRVPEGVVWYCVGGCNNEPSTTEETD